MEGGPAACPHTAAASVLYMISHGERGEQARQFASEVMMHSGCLYECVCCLYTCKYLPMVLPPGKLSVTALSALRL